jgi:hypothetical protein
MTRKRTRYSADFKAKVALEAPRGWGRRFQRPLMTGRSVAFALRLASSPIRLFHKLRMIPRGLAILVRG